MNLQEFLGIPRFFYGFLFFPGNSYGFLVFFRKYQGFLAFSRYLIFQIIINKYFLRLNMVKNMKNNEIINILQFTPPLENMSPPSAPRHGGGYHHFWGVNNVSTVNPQKGFTQFKPQKGGTYFLGGGVKCKILIISLFFIFLNIQGFKYFK